MRKNFCIIFLILLLFSDISFGAEAQKDLAADYVTKIQNEISGDISKLRVDIEKELSEIKLDEPDIKKRLDELAALTEKSSDDLSAWGYTDEQKELHNQILSELSAGYSAYGSLTQSASKVSNESEKVDVSSLSNVESPDINMSDSTRMEIRSVSRGLETQVFYLLSKINKLKTDLSEAQNLSKKIKEAQEGGEALELPRTQILELELSRLNIALSRLQVRAMKTSFDSNVSTIQRLRRRLADMNGKLIFPQSLLDSNLEKVQTRLNELTRERSEANKTLDSANSSLVRARVNLGSADVNILTNASASYMARSARASYWEHMLALIDDEIEITREIQQVWRNRFGLFHDQFSGSEIWSIRDSAQTRVDELQKQLEGVRNLESVVLRDIDSIQAKASGEGISGTIQQNILQAAENRRKIVSEVFNRYESLIPRAVFYHQRLYEEANENLNALKLAEKVSSFSKETVMGFMNTELWQGEGYSVTVSKLIIALAVFISSFFLSSWGSKWIKRRMIKRFKASITAANAVQRIVFYILWVAFALIALNIVKIPLTAFAFMGGAFAVGIGFGMQNIFNNLISGFIVIFSRPFKVNDIIDVAGTQGMVEDIGSRSTTIRTWDGFDVVLPNRYFLENSVTNWTGSDLKKREVLKIGVSYDADTREVEKLLLDVAKGHSKVLKDPAPFVIFKNFGDNSLEFELYFWIELKVSSGAKVSSDMRHHITAVFRREGINIPYPQRDIHIIKDSQENESGEDQNA